MLCERLHEELDSLSAQLVKKEREELRKRRLKYVAISVDNILKKPTRSERKKSTDVKNEFNSKDKNEISNDDKENDIQMIDETNQEKDDNEDVDDEEQEDEEESGSDRSDEYDEIGKILWDEEESDQYSNRKSRSHRNRKTINYQFTEYDELINSAIQQEMDVDISFNDSIGIESKGKDMSNIIANNTEELDFSCSALETLKEDLKCGQTVDECVPQTEQKIDDLVKDDEKEDDEEDEEEEDQKSDENDSNVETNKTQKANKQKQTKTKRNFGYKRRHRGLNDLDVTTEDDDDSDEDFKGDSSATEVDEGSDEFVDDASTAEDEEVSDDSDFKYSRRKSTRNVRKSSNKSKGKQNKRNKGGAKVGKRGYRRDEFVVSSDESDADYRPGVSRTRTRAAARKKISYREETSEDESEDDYYWKSSNTRSKRHAKSESSDEEWGRKITSKNNKHSKEDEDDEEEDEEEDEDENDDNDEDEEDERDEEEEKPVYKPGPKSSKTSGRILMKGKPRLSKAKGLLNLKEESDDEDFEISEKSNKNKVNKKTRKFNKLSDSEDEENVNENEIKDKDKVKGESVSNNKDITNEEKILTNNEQIVETKNFVTESNNLELIQTQKTCAQSIPENSTNNQSFNNKNENLKTSASIETSLASKPPQMIVTRDNSQLPQEAALNIPQLTQQNNSYPQTEQQINKQHNISLDNNNLKDNNIEEYYSLATLDSYPTSRPPPLKPTVINDPYLQASSPPRILTLESNAYSRHPSLDYSPAHHSLPPKGLIDPRLERPFLSSGQMPTPFVMNAPNLRNELRSAAHHSSGHNFGSQSRPPYYPQAPPPYYSRPHSRPDTPFTGPHIRAQTSSPIPSRTPSTGMSGPPQLNYRPPTASPWNQAPASLTSTPGYNFAHPSPPYYGSPQSQQPSHGVPLPPSYSSSYPPNYGYYSHNSGNAPNGAFMIHNLLQHRPPIAEDNSQTPLSGPPNSGEDMRTGNESFTTYMSQE
jgi:hypothetical protein